MPRAASLFLHPFPLLAPSVDTRHVRHGGIISPFLIPSSLSIPRTRLLFIDFFPMIPCLPCFDCSGLSVSISATKNPSFPSRIYAGYVCLFVVLLFSALPVFASEYLSLWLSVVNKCSLRFAPSPAIRLRVRITLYVHSILGMSTKQQTQASHLVCVCVCVRAHVCVCVGIGALIVIENVTFRSI